MLSLRLPSTAIVIFSLVCTTPAGVAWAAPAPEGTGGEAAAKSIEPSPEAVEAAIEAGDLSLARDIAVALREADPSLDNRRLEARTWVTLGDYAAAKATLEAGQAELEEELDAMRQAAVDEAAEAGEELDPASVDLGSEGAAITAEIGALDEELAALDEASRGTVADEPESTHREAMDDERAARLAALAPKPEPPPAPIDGPAPIEIHKKWYFWVTLGAIVASAGAIVALGIRNGVDERNEQSSAQLPAPAPAGPGKVGLGAGGVVFRF